MVGERDLLRDVQEGESTAGLFGGCRIGTGERLLHRAGDGVGTDRRVRLHDFEFLGAQLALFEQDRVGDADLADVVQRRRLDDHLQAPAAERVAKTLVVGQLASEQFDVGLRAQDVMAGLQVARLGEAGECAHREVLDQQVLAHASIDLALEPVVFLRQPVAGHLQFELGAHPRQHDRRVDRLGDVIDRAQFESAFLVLGGVHRGDEDDRDLARGRVLAQVLQDLVAVHLGHHHVEQDQVGTRVGHRRTQGPGAGIGGADAILRLQQFTENGQVLRRVIDDQDGACRCFVE